MMHPFDNNKMQFALTSLDFRVRHSIASNQISIFEINNDLFAVDFNVHKIYPVLLVKILP